MELGNVHDDDGYVTTVLGNGNVKELDLSNSLRQSLVNTYRLLEVELVSSVAG